MLVYLLVYKNITFVHWSIICKINTLTVNVICNVAVCYSIHATVKSTVSKQRSELRKLPVFFVNPLLLPTCQCTDVAFVANLATLGFGSKTLLNYCKLRPNFATGEKRFHYRRRPNYFVLSNKFDSYTETKSGRKP